PSSTAAESAPAADAATAADHAAAADTATAADHAAAADTATAADHAPAAHHARAATRVLTLACLVGQKDRIATATLVDELLETQHSYVKGFDCMELLRLFAVIDAHCTPPDRWGD